MDVLDLTNKDLKKVIENETVPVLVVFEGPWCGPCQEVSPELTAIGKILEDRLKIARINVDESPKLTKEFKVRNIPTMMVFKEGKLTRRMGGYHDKDEILEALK